jgi:hypothetical protein
LKQVKNRTDLGYRRTNDNGYCKSFEEWWSAYPKKVAKEAAFRAWKKAGKKLKTKMVSDSKEVAAFLLRFCKAYAVARADQDPQYTLNPATWLNQGHWDDDQATWKSSHNGKQQAKPEETNRAASLDEMRKAYGCTGDK